MPEARQGWIALNCVPGIGPGLSRRLAEGLGTPTAAFSATTEQLQTIRGISPALIDRLRQCDWQALVEKELSLCQTQGIRVLTFTDQDYPEPLKNLDLSPTVLYVLGTLLPPDAQALAVVGTRQPTNYGISATRMLVKDLVKAGFTIVSGLARGIDTEAHQTALKCQGRTIAVLAHGLDQVYPRENQKLLDRLTEQGAAVTEFPLGVEPLASNFPRRNRIISGLSRGVLVVEAGKRSGSLITARWALEQGREVFAVPSFYSAPLSRGTHALIQDGAKLVTGVQDILNEFSFQPALLAENHERKALFPEILTQMQTELMQALGSGEQHIDHLALTCGLPVSRLLVELLVLEMKGVVKSAPGQRYQRV